MIKGLSVALAATTAALALGEAADAQQSAVDLNVGVSIYSDPDADAATGRLSGLLSRHFGVEGDSWS